METVEQILERYKNIRQKMLPPPIITNRALEFRPKEKKPVPLKTIEIVKPAAQAIAIMTEEPVKEPVLPMIKMKPACLKPIEVEDPIRFSDIVKWVCQRTGYSRSELMSIRRHKDLTLARHLVWQIAKKTTSLSYPQMGKLFGDRDHTTVLHAIRKTPPNINLIIIEMMRDIRTEAIEDEDEG